MDKMKKKTLKMSFGSVPMDKIKKNSLKMSFRSVPMDDMTQQFNPVVINCPESKITSPYSVACTFGFVSDKKGAEKTFLGTFPVE